MRAQRRQARAGGDRRVQLQSDAERENLVDLRAQQRARQAVLWNAEPHHAARLGRRFEHRDAIAELRQVVCRGETRGARADDGHLALMAARGFGPRRRTARQGRVTGIAIAFRHGVLAQLVLRVGTNRLDAVLLGDETFQRANRHRCVDCAASACVLARRGTHTATDRGEGIRRTRDEIRVFIAALGDELNVATGVGADRTPALALDLGLPMLEIREDDLKTHEMHHTAQRFQPV